MAHVIGRGRYARETYPSPPAPPPTPPPPLPFTVIFSDTVTVPAFGSVLLGPFTRAPGTALDAVVDVVSGLDFGFLASWGVVGGGVQVAWTWDDDPPGSRTLHIVTSGGNPAICNVRVIHWD